MTGYKNQAFTKISHQEEEKIKTEHRLRTIIGAVLSVLLCEKFTYPY